MKIYTCECGTKSICDKCRKCGTIIKEDIKKDEYVSSLELYTVRRQTYLLK